METSEQPILVGFEAASLCSQPECPASLRVWPGSGEAAKMTVGSGRQCSMLLEQSSRLGLFSKILMESLRWTSSAEYCYVWNRLGTYFGLSAFQLTVWGQSTEDTECSLLGTVMTSEGGPNAHTQGVKQTLHRLWPTAHANCATGAGTQERDGGLNLQTAVKLWP